MKAAVIFAFTLLIKANSESLLSAESYDDNSTNYTMVDTSYMGDDTYQSNDTLTRRCNVDSDCMELNSCLNSNCHHNGLLPITWRGTIGLIGLLVGLSLSSAVGMGGGGLILPNLILILNFHTHQAIPISKTIVLSNSFVAFLMHLNSDHSHHSKTIIYELATIIIPGLILGTTIGVQINKMLQGPLLLVILSSSLIVLAARATINAVQYYNKELSTDEIKESKQKEMTDLVSNEESHSKNENLNLENRNITKRSKTCIFRMLLPYVTFLIYIFIKYSNSLHPSLTFEDCSTNSIILYSGIVILLILIEVYSGYVLMNYSSDKIQYDNNSQLVWNSRLILKFFAIAIIVGIVSSSFGLGGGVIMSPLLIELGFSPISATHTSNFLILFTASSTLIQFYFQGQIVIEYVTVIWILPIITAIIGYFFINNLISKTKKQYPFLVVISFVLIIASLSVAIYTVIRLFGIQNLLSFIFKINKLCS